MNRKCYLIAFTIILLAVGYPILLSIFFSRTSKDDSSFPDSEQACNFKFCFICCGLLNDNDHKIPLKMLFFLFKNIYRIFMIILSKFIIMFKTN